nr:retinol dehydrogenase 13-like isoform X1 [Chelonoidis abingdonii]
MEFSCFGSHLGWAACVLALALLLRARRKGSWHPRMSPTDLTGKTAIVTGANCGIGKYVALDLARRNARTILACRSRERGQAAVEEIQRATGNPNVLLRIVDISNMASIRHFAKQIRQEEKRLDILVNNAGVTDTMQSSAPARIVNISSFRHVQGMANMKHLTGEERPKNFDQSYTSTKLMNILFTNELARRLQGTVRRGGSSQHHLLRRLRGGRRHHGKVLRQQLQAGAALCGCPRPGPGPQAVGGVGASDGPPGEWAHVNNGAHHPCPAAPGYCHWDLGRAGGETGWRWGLCWRKPAGRKVGIS